MIAQPHIPQTVAPEAAAATDAATTTPARTVGRIVLGLLLALIGLSHLTVARRGFRVAVPDWVPGDPDTTVVASGIVEIGLGTAMLFAHGRRRLVGTLTALFLVAVFPGNVSQWTHRLNAPGLDTDMKRFARLFLQPVLIGLVLWATRGPRRRTR